MKLITELLVLFGAISLVCCFPIDHTTARTVSARRGLLMLAEPNSNNNNADKFRTIKPSDIDSLFGNNSPKKSSITDDNDEDDDTDYDYFDDEEVSLDLVAGTISSASSANNKKADVSSSVEPAVMSTKSGKSTNSDTESQIMGELKALEDMGAFAEDAIANSGEEQDDLELSYVNLRKSLDKVLHHCSCKKLRCVVHHYLDY